MKKITFFLIAVFIGTFGFQSYARTTSFFSDQTASLACSPAIDLEITDITSNSVTLNWSEIPEAANGYIISIHDYSLNPNPDMLILESQTIPMGTLTATFDGLAQGTFYHIFIITDCASEGLSGGVFKQFNTVANFPPNNICQSATKVTCGETITGSTLAATAEGNPPNTSCGTELTVPGVWYEINDTGGNADDISIDICVGNPSDMDSIIYVYKGDDCDNLECVSVNDDTCNFRSSVTFASDGNTTFYIFVSGFIGSGQNIGNYELNVTGSCSEALGVDGFAFSNFNLSPNPANDVLHIQNDTAIDTIEIYSLTGKRVLTTLTTSNEVDLAITNLSSGLYLLKASINGNTVTKKFIKK